MKYLKSVLLISLALLIMLVILPGAAVYALVSPQSNRIYDEAGLFTDSDISRLKSTIDGLISEYDIDIILWTSNEYSSQTSRQLSDDFYNNNDFGMGNKQSGIMIFFNMSSREINIIAKGNAKKHFSSKNIENILDEITPLMSRNLYYETADRFLDNVNKYMSITPAPPFYRTIPGMILIAAVISLIIVLIMVAGSNANTKKVTTNKDTYLLKDSFSLLVNSDTFINKTVTTARVPRNTGSSGSSGRSSGGSNSGTRKF